MKNTFIKVFLALLMVYVVLQMPFFEADPEVSVSSSRGAFTDEGLHVSQVRNLMLGDTSIIAQSDNLLKTPLFGVLNLFGIVLYGNSIELSRIFFFVLSVIALLWGFTRNNRNAIIGLGFLVFGLMEFHIFHFAHYSLAEFLASCWIVLSMLIIVDDKIKQSYKIIAPVILLAVFFLKIQFAYVAPIIVGMLAYLFHLQKKAGGIAFAVLVILCVSFLFLWYLPNQDLFHFIMSDQTDGRFVSKADFLDHLEWLWQNVFTRLENVGLTISLLLALFWGVPLLRSQKEPNRLLLIFAYGWFLIECHKLFFTYFPTRYFIPLYFSMAFLVAIVGYIYFQKSKLGSASYLVALLFCLGLNSHLYFNKSLKGIRYASKNTNEYFSEIGMKDKIIAGTWASTLAWNSEAKTYPVWKDYFNDPKKWNHYPDLVIEELGEGSSNQAYKANGIDLQELSDSVKSVQIGRWDIRIYWMNKKGINR